MKASIKAQMAKDSVDLENFDAAISEMKACLGIVETESTKRSLAPSIKSRLELMSEVQYVLTKQKRLADLMSIKWDVTSLLDTPEALTAPILAQIDSEIALIER